MTWYCNQGLWFGSVDKGECLYKVVYELPIHPGLLFFIIALMTFGLWFINSIHYEKLKHFIWNWYQTKKRGEL